MCGSPGSEVPRGDASAQALAELRTDRGMTRREEENEKKEKPLLDFYKVRMPDVERRTRIQGFPMPGRVSGLATREAVLLLRGALGNVP